MDIIISVTAAIFKPDLVDHLKLDHSMPACQPKLPDFFSPAKSSFRKHISHNTSDHTSAQLLPPCRGWRAGQRSISQSMGSGIPYSLSVTWLLMQSLTILYNSTSDTIPVTKLSLPAALTLPSAGIESKMCWVFLSLAASDDWRSF